MGHNQMKEGHGPTPIYMAEILVIILATNSHLQSTCCTLVASILFYHMRHVPLCILHHPSLMEGTMMCSTPYYIYGTAQQKS